MGPQKKGALRLPSSRLTGVFDAVWAGIEALILVLAETHLSGCHRPALSGPGLLRGSACPVGDGVSFEDAERPYPMWR
jgi:hypothetical protein